MMAKSALLPLLLALTCRGLQPSEDQGIVREVPSGGFWIDRSTGLMWAGKDNGRDIRWGKAMQYCKDLRLGGYFDWRLASLEEVRGIFDKNQSAAGLAGDGKTIRQTSYHVKGSLLLTGMQWTSTRILDDRGKPSGYAWRFDFRDGRAFNGDELSFKVSKRALCVRGPDE